MMLKTALFLLVDEYADWEGAYLSSQLNLRTDWEIKTASLQPYVTSIGGFKTKVDYLLNEIPESIHLFIMIGGNSWGGIDNSLKDTVQRLLERNVIVGAICGAVDYLARNGLLNNYNHTGNTVLWWKDYPLYTNEANFVEEQAIRDANLITANGTATLDFTALVLNAVLADQELEIKKTITLHQLGYYSYCEKYGNPFM